VISGFHCELDENCNFLGYYATDVSAQPIGTTLLRNYHSPNSSLYKPHTKVTSFILGLLTLEDVTKRFSCNVGIELSLYAV
jgi:hypothetical protein